MKIAHLNNLSGVASVIAKYQVRQGHHAEVFVFNRTIHKQFGGNKIFYLSPISRYKLFKKLRDYDVWHYHYPYGSLKRNLEMRNKDKIYLKHYHGGDLKGKHDEDFCLVSTPDLLQYAPNGRWLPNPIDLEEIESISREPQQKNRIARVSYYPHYKLYDSNDYCSDVLNSLEKEKKCEIVEIFKLPHLKALQIMNTSDIIIGKILPDIGWFGKFELEGMALGKPVITFVKDELYEKYRPPVYRTTRETFKKDLEDLLEDSVERVRLATEGHHYIKTNHSAESVVKIVQECYNACGR